MGCGDKEGHTFPSFFIITIDAFYFISRKRAGLETDRTGRRIQPRKLFYIIAITVGNIGCECIVSCVSVARTSVTVVKSFRIGGLVQIIATSKIQWEDGSPDVLVATFSASVGFPSLLDVLEYFFFLFSF